MNKPTSIPVLFSNIQTAHDWAIITASEVSNCQNWVLAATATSLTTGQYVRLIWFGWLVMFIGIKQCVWSIWSVLGWLVKEVISCDVLPVTIFFSYWRVCDVDLVMVIGRAMCVVDMVSIGLVGWRHISDHLSVSAAVPEKVMIHCNYGFSMSYFCWRTHCTAYVLLLHKHITHNT